MPRTVVVAHKVNRRSLLLKYLRVGVEMVEFDVTLEGGALLVKHGADVGSRGLRGFVMALGYLLLEGRDPLLKPSTLEEHLRLAGGRAGVWLDLKAKGIEKEAAALARAYGAKPVVVSSGFHNTLRFAREGCEDAVIMLGNVSYRPADPVREVELASADGLSIHHAFVDEEMVEELHSAGYKVAVWTVNDPAKARELAELGVDYLITDHPEKVRRFAERP